MGEDKITVTWDEIQHPAPPADQPSSTGETAARACTQRKRRWLILAIAVLAVLLVGTGAAAIWFTLWAGCGDPADATKQAILRVLKADEQIAQEFVNFPEGATSSQIAKGIGLYCDKLSRVDMSDCPADFVVAMRQHLRAWRETQAIVAQMPENVIDAAVVGFFNALLRGELDGGTARLEGQAQKADERVRDTWERVETVAAKYGVAL